MKNLLFIILGVLMIASCSNNGLEDQAKEQLKKTMKELLKNPDAADLTNMTTKINNDSLCIIHFNCKAQNDMGGDGSTNYEYIYLKHDNDYREGLFNLDEDESVIAKAKKGLDSDKDTANENITKEELEMNAIYLMALGSVLFDGREVGND